MEGYARPCITARVGNALNSGYVFVNTDRCPQSAQVDDVPDPGGMNQRIGILVSLVTAHPDSQPRSGYSQSRPASPKHQQP
jgi:hypothetical protein